MTLIDTSRGRSVLAIGWNKARLIHMDEFPHCAACGFKPKFRRNDCHHIIARHIAWWLATDLENLLTLCRVRGCHLRIGHFDSYTKYWNPNIVAQLTMQDGRFICDHIREQELDFKAALPEQLREWAVQADLRKAA